MEKIDKALKSKIENSKVYAEIKRLYDEYTPDLKAGKLSVRNLYYAYIVPIIPEGETISYQNFNNWHKKVYRHTDEINEGKSLMQLEIEKTEQQIRIRQDVTELMSKFIKGLKELAEDPEALRNSNINVKDLYKIIRQEEDRAKELGLKERAENRADAQFAFMVALARAGQLTDEDIEFLEEDTKAALLDFKVSHGIYQLQPNKQLAEVPVAAENTAALATESN